MKQIKRLELWNVIKDVSVSLRSESLIKHLSGILKVPIDDPPMKRKVTTFLSEINKRWLKVNRHSDRLSTFYKDWLDGSENFETGEPKPPPEAICTKLAGRPQDDFESLSTGRKRKRTQELRGSTSAAELGFASHMKLREEGNKKAATVVQRVLDSSPRTLQVMFAFVGDLKKKADEAKNNAPIMYTLPEALAYVVQCKLSKEQFIFQRRSLNAHNVSVLPSYDQLREYRKKHCYPAGIVVSETRASVSLQNLLDHTSTRLIGLQSDVLNIEKLASVTKVQLISKTGFDGSSSHSRYNQIWNSGDIEADDSSMLLSSLVPLLLHVRDETSGLDLVIWMNPRPSSTMWCRPLELEYAKETVPKIKVMCERLRHDIAHLEDSVVKFGDRVVNVTHHVLPTMVDGKVSSAATGTSAQNCNVCKATPSEMNSIDVLLQKDCDDSALVYGVSVLHAYIRFLEYVLNVAYRLEIKVGYQKYTPEQKESMARKKREIQKEAKILLGVHIDRPSPGGGNTNTGNVARRLFGNPVQAAQISGINIDILIKINNVLRTLACGYAIDVKVFSTYTIQLARDLVREYGFWYMSVSVHTVLLHGAAFIPTFPVPIGMLSEECSESCNKDVRALRQRHSRTRSRQEGLYDIFHGLLVRSDPVISSLRKAPKPRGHLESGVTQFLIQPDLKSQEVPQGLPEIQDESGESDIDGDLH